MSKTSKRKGAESLSTPPTKKSKTAVTPKPKSAKPTSAEKSPVDFSPPIDPVGPIPIPLPEFKKTRKTAADFLSDEDTAPVPVDTSKPTKKARKQVQTTSSAKTKTAAKVPPRKAGSAATRLSRAGDDDTDFTEHIDKEQAEKSRDPGLRVLQSVEDNGDQNKRKRKPAAAKSSDMAEKVASSSKEVADNIEDVVVADVTPAADDEAELLKGFDSDTPDDVQEQGLDIRETPPILDPTGNIEKELTEAKRKSGPDDEPGTIYVGHIPHGFFEVQMRAFYSQFGDITKLRLSRNRRTGASKHFAFIEFASVEVAKIAAKTMDGYLMFGQILKSKFAPAESLHPDVWKGANKKFHKVPNTKLEGQMLAAPKSAEKWDSKKAKEEARRKKKAKSLEQIGYEMPSGPIAEPKAVAAAAKTKTKVTDDGVKKAKKVTKEKRKST